MTAATSWVAHLRAGGATPWDDWLRAHPDPTADPAADPAAEPLPGAAQLELLRLLNVATPLPHRAEHVLRRPGPGRGPAHLGLPRTGPAAPVEEVARVAGGVLADLTAELPDPDPGPPPTGGARPGRRRAPSFVLDGLPVSVAVLRADLAVAGLTEHRPRLPWFGRSRPQEPDLCVVLAGPVTEALHQAWVRRVQDGAARPWSGFTTAWARQGRLPPSAQVDQSAAGWARRIGPERVHLVVLDGPNDERAAQVVMDLLGRPGLLGPASGPAERLLPGDPVPLDPALVDVLRRVNDVLSFLPDADAARQRAALVDLMRAEHVGPARVALPEGRRAWAARTGVRLAEGVAATGCVVHGDPAALARTEVGGEPLPVATSLAAAVRMIARVDARVRDVATGRGRG